MKLPHWSLPGWVRLGLGLLAPPVLAVLLVYNLRRILFTLTILAPAKVAPARSSAPADQPDLLVLVPCRDEAGMIAGLGSTLAAVDYPPQHLQVVFINDGSGDGTSAAMHAQAQDRPGWFVLDLPVNQGKASALNTALAAFPFGEIVYVLDADHRPHPQALDRLVRYFADPTVAGVSGRTVAANPTASPSSFYSMVEGLVHQMVTMRAKDRLDLAPALLGSNCAYRRSALAQFGFRAGALLEDSDLTLALALAGQRLRFAPDVVATHQVPTSVSGYVRQHTRWGRGFLDVAREFLPRLVHARQQPVPLRLELALFSLGYIDRIAWLAGGVLSGLATLFPGQVTFPRSAFLASLVLPWLQIVAVFAEQRLPAQHWLRLAYVPVFFCIDIWSAVQASLAALRRLPAAWTRTERAVERP